MLCDLLKHRQNIHAIYRKLPLILGGEQSVSTDEPVRSINQFMNELEQDPRILSCSWHVGYLRHDCPEAGCGIVVIPQTEADQAYAETIADQLAEFVWNKRHEFHYTGTTAAPDEALAMALAFDGKPVFITDSGDNVTSGAMGANTFILRQVLALPALSKRILFAAINDPAACHQLMACAENEQVSLRLGMGLDAYSEPVDLDVVVLHHGRQAGTAMYGEEGDYGPIVTVRLPGTPIDIAVTNNNHSFVEIRQLTACGINVEDYDIFVVKQGYIHPELKALGKLCVMSLTGGATPQDTRLIPFKQILRPMFPIDEI